MLGLIDIGAIGRTSQQDVLFRSTYHDAIIGRFPSGNHSMEDWAISRRGMTLKLSPFPD